MLFRVCALFLFAEACLSAATSLRDIADPEGYFDTVLSALDDSIREHGYDNLALPDGSIGFDDPISGHLSVSNGSVHHLESIHREGEVTQTEGENGTLILTTNVVINNFTASYHLHADLLTWQRNADLIVTVDRVVLSLTVVKDSDGNVTLSSFHVVELGNIDVEITPDDGLAEIITPVLTALLRDLLPGGIDALIEDPIDDLLQEVLDANPIVDAKY